MVKGKVPKEGINKRTGKKNEYLYFIRIGEPSDRLFKIGTTSRPAKRMKEHEDYYKADITILWFSPALSSKYTTLRVEDRMKDIWKKLEDWTYQRNDRFKIPNNVNTITIKIKKEYLIEIA